MILIFTDLDATLLDAETYSWDAARPALELLGERGIPWVMVSSKTRAEMEHLREEIGHRHPYVVENGGAAYIPAGYFNAMPAAERMVWGTPYAELVTALRAAAKVSGCRVRGLHEMTDAEVSRLTGLPMAAAARARQREYDEPFEILDGDRAPALLTAIEGAGFRWTHGGRLHHILGNNDKATAVRALTARYVRQFGPVRTIGLGDSLNDLPLLRAVDTPVLVRSDRTPAPELLALGARYTREPGPAGWNESVLALLGAGPASSEMAPE